MQKCEKFALVKCKLEVSPAAEEVVKGDGGGGEGLGDGHGEPDAGVAEQAGHDDEAWDDEDEAAQAGEEHGGLHLFEALEEADGGYVGDVEDVAEGEEGQAVDGDAGGASMAMRAALPSWPMNRPTRGPGRSTNSIMPTKPQMTAVIIDRRLTDRTRSILPAP